MKRILLLVAALALAGCATQPVVQVQGNGYCHPSADLPAHKTLAPVPEDATKMDDLFAILATERKTHAADDRDYNSLYTQCVGPAATTPSTPAK